MKLREIQSRPINELDQQYRSSAPASSEPILRKSAESGVEKKVFKPTILQHNGSPCAPNKSLMSRNAILQQQDVRMYRNPVQSSQNYYNQDRTMQFSPTKTMFLQAHPMQINQLQSPNHPFQVSQKTSDSQKPMTEQIHESKAEYSSLTLKPVENNSDSGSNEKDSQDTKTSNECNSQDAGSTHESPTMNKQFVFDLTSTNFTDLASDLNEFNSFYSNKSCNQHTKGIERPQNPHFKNFKSYQETNKLGFTEPQQRNSFTLSLNRTDNNQMNEFSSRANSSEMLPSSMKKQRLVQDYNHFNFSQLNKVFDSHIQDIDIGHNSLLNENRELQTNYTDANYKSGKSNYMKPTINNNYTQ